MSVDFYIWLACSFLFASVAAGANGVGVGLGGEVGVSGTPTRSLCANFMCSAILPVCDFFPCPETAKTRLSAVAAGGAGRGAWLRPMSAWQGCLHAMFNVWRLLLRSRRLRGPQHMPHDQSTRRVRRMDAQTASTARR